MCSMKHFASYTESTQLYTVRVQKRKQRFNPKYLKIEKKNHEIVISG